jgi:hypothetical protein
VLVREDVCLGKYAQAVYPIAPPIYRILSVIAVMVAINSVGHTICAMIEDGMMTPPTPILARVTTAYITAMLSGVDVAIAPVPVGKYVSSGGSFRWRLGFDQQSTYRQSSEQ